VPPVPFQTFPQLFSRKIAENHPVFYEAIQHFFQGFQKSVGRLRSKKSVERWISFYGGADL